MALQPLTLHASGTHGDEIQEGFLLADDGTRYPIIDGLADLTYPRSLSDADARARAFYDNRVDDYDRYLHLTFETFGEREDDVRESMVDLLKLEKDSTLLEVGCGSGRDSVHLARRIPKGRFFCQDLSAHMLTACRKRLRDCEAAIDISVANASYLPFADNTFDALFQFGGVGEFGDIRRFFAEAVRVTRPGGRIVVGDESMPPWLRTTEFSKILTVTNPQYAAPVPLNDLPIEARQVCLRWIIGGTFYLIDFTVGEGEPPADFDFPIPGPRGGTRRTRYEGQLEGVTSATKRLAQQARERANVSMHDWLERVVRDAASRELGADEKSK
ncbi:MAG: class I SAM-dependent methyltransferase [Candidatus Aquilonibacter sp.]